MAAQTNESEQETLERHAQNLTPWQKTVFWHWAETRPFHLTTMLVDGTYRQKTQEKADELLEQKAALRNQMREKANLPPNLPTLERIQRENQIGDAAEELVLQSFLSPPQDD
jgi:hypothetical protein